MCLSNPMISVIMSCYQESLDILQEAVKSILLQTYQEFEFIVIVDDPSNKESIEYLKNISSVDSRLKLFINNTNKGLVYSLNKAIDISSGKYIARMDADDVSVRTRLYDQLEYIEGNELDFIGGYYIKIKNNGSHIKEIHHPISPCKVANALKRGACVGHPTWFLKKNVYLKLGGYDNIPLCEDYHFLLKARAMNFRIGNMPKVCLFYRLTPNSISRNNLARQTMISKFLSNNIDSLNNVNAKIIEEYLSDYKTIKYMNCVEDYINMVSEIKDYGLSKNTLARLLMNKYFYEVLFNKVVLNI